MSLLPIKLILSAVLLAAAFSPDEKLCEPADCIAMIGRYVPVSRVHLNKSKLIGCWSRDLLGMAGSNLYLFEDGSYLYTWWTDVMPEIVGDKGTWKHSTDVIYLTSTPDVTWQVGLDRRHLTVKFRSDPYVSLIAIDDNLRNDLGDAESLMNIVHENALTRRRRWNNREGEQIKAKVMQESWMPWWNECNQDPNKCPDIAAPEAGTSEVKSQ